MTFNKYLNNLLSCFNVKHTENKIKCSAEDFFSKCEQTVNYSFSHITKEILDETFFVLRQMWLQEHIWYVKFCLWNQHENVVAFACVFGMYMRI